MILCENVETKSCGVLVSCVSVIWGLEQLLGPQGRESLEGMRGKEVGLGLGLGREELKVRVGGLGIDKGRRSG